MADTQEKILIIDVPVPGVRDCVDTDEGRQSTISGSDRAGTNTPGSPCDGERITVPAESHDSQDQIKGAGEMNEKTGMVFMSPGTAYNSIQTPTPVETPIMGVTYADNAPNACCYRAIENDCAFVKICPTSPPIGDNETHDAMSDLPQLSSEDFKILNRNLFNYDPQEGYSGSHERLVTLFVGSTMVRIHARVLVRCKVLQEKFKFPAKPLTLTDMIIFQDVGIAEVKILMQAIYGIQSPVLGHSTYQGADYMNALWLSDMLECIPGVYDSVALCAQAHFSAFKYWQSIPSNSMTQDFHRTKLAEINQAFKAHKSRAPGYGPQAFRDNSFAVLLAKYCPDFVYCLYSDTLDYDLAHQVGVAAMRMRDRVAPFSIEEMKLITFPIL